MTQIQRPLILYHGSKWRIADWVISHFPRHRTFVDLFGGSASILLKKRRAEIEVYNDIDGEIVNLMKVARDRGEELAQLLGMTPYARDEFRESFVPADDPVERARRTVVRSFQGYGGSYATRGSKATPGGFRVAYQPGNNPSRSWTDIPANILEIAKRFQGVYIENLDFRKILARYDREDTLIYADPPYLPETRDYGSDYSFEMNSRDHYELAQLLNKHKGPAVISGYHSAFYDELYGGWLCKKKDTTCASNKKRTEKIWIKGLEPDLFTALESAG
jgi:DNA adenine methylase